VADGTAGLKKFLGQNISFPHYRTALKYTEALILKKYIEYLNVTFYWRLFSGLRNVLRFDHCLSRFYPKKFSGLLLFMGIDKN
jgi:hypothetical protein